MKNQAENIEVFKQSFREEARETLVDLEAALLELNESPSDAELVGRVFRGLHTIKGSGAMFGFEAMAAFTHNLETAFDAVRNGRLAITGELVDLTLAALDQIKSLLEGKESASSEAAESREQLLAKVRRLSGVAETDRSGSKPINAETPATVNVSPAREWSVQFAPGPDFLLNGSNPLLLIKELRQLGGLSVCASMAATPTLAELEPERCYITWDMVLSTASDANAIRDVFIFVEEGCELKIELLGAGSPAEGAEIDLASGAQEELQSGSSLKSSQGIRSGSNSGPNPGSNSGLNSGARRGDERSEVATSLRVPAAKLDQFVDLVGELVTVQARLSELAGRRDDAEIAAVSEEIERLTSSLRENSMNIRMVPIRATFEKFRRLVHDLARDLGKDVELTMDGADTELDKTVVDQLGDPLMHLIRNSMDHGIEAKALRLSRGKRTTANLHLSARYSGASVLIAVTDDGGGIDAEAVRRRAVDKGLVTADAELGQAQTFALIFQPGFSTAAKVTDVSGRGVGMDVVRQRVEALRGAIEVSSEPGHGTVVTLRLPLTLAIIDGLLVSVSDACFVLPLASTLECIELSAADIERANGKHVANLRGEVVPYIRLREHFNICLPRPDLEQIMVVETADGRFGFVVDQVLGNCQTVIKSLGRFYRRVQTISGATILGDGRVALILDPERLVQDAIKGSVEGARGHPGVAFRGNRTKNAARI